MDPEEVDGFLEVAEAWLKAVAGREQEVQDLIPDYVDWLIRNRKDFRPGRDRVRPEEKEKLINQLQGMLRYEHRRYYGSKEKEVAQIRENLELDSAEPAEASIGRRSVWSSLADWIEEALGLDLELHETAEWKRQTEEALKERPGSSGCSRAAAWPSSRSSTHRPLKPASAPPRLRKCSIARAGWRPPRITVERESGAAAAGRNLRHQASRIPRSRAPSR